MVDKRFFEWPYRIFKAPITAFSLSSLTKTCSREIGVFLGKCTYVRSLYRQFIDLYKNPNTVETPSLFVQTMSLDQSTTMLRARDCLKQKRNPGGSSYGRRVRSDKMYNLLRFEWTQGVNKLRKIPEEIFTWDNKPVPLKVILNNWISNCTISTDT